MFAVAATNPLLLGPAPVALPETAAIAPVPRDDCCLPPALVRDPALTLPGCYGGFPA